MPRKFQFAWRPVHNEFRHSGAVVLSLAAEIGVVGDALQRAKRYTVVDGAIGDGLL
jgi:hypothetical protein